MVAGEDQSDDQRRSNRPRVECKTAYQRRENPLAYMDSWADGESDVDALRTSSRQRAGQPRQSNRPSRPLKVTVVDQASMKWTNEPQRTDYRDNTTQPANRGVQDRLSGLFRKQPDPYEPAPQRKKKQEHKSDAAPAFNPWGVLKFGIALIVIAVIACSLPAILDKAGAMVDGTASNVASIISNRVGLATAALGGVTIPWALALRLTHTASSIIRKLVSLIVIVLAVIAVWWAGGLHYDASCSHPVDASTQVCDALSIVHDDKKA